MMYLLYGFACYSLFIKRKKHNPTINNLFLFSFQKKTYSKMNNPAIKRVGTHIIKSPEDKREYRGLELANGIKVLLISDPTTDKSSAALDVHIGTV